MHVYANPARFLKLARPLTAWLGWVGAAVAAAPTVYSVYYLPVGLMLTRIFLNELHQVYGTA